MCVIFRHDAEGTLFLGLIPHVKIFDGDPATDRLDLNFMMPPEMHLTFVFAFPIHLKYDHFRLYKTRSS